jgi:predicted Zn-dependent peptidase
VDILRGALVTTPLTAAYLGKVREARIKKLSEGKPSAAEISDLAIANRLLGAFPYTQPIGGTIGSLKNIELADVMLARDRFMSPDNATLAIVGGVDQRRAMRALRRHALTLRFAMIAAERLTRAFDPQCR